MGNTNRRRIGRTVVNMIYGKEYGAVAGGPPQVRGASRAFSRPLVL
jgi:hypothetical protein